MLEDDESSSTEDNSVSGGPPPDPSTRAWRHPSEIAAAHAAALRDLRPAPPAPHRLSEHWSLGSFVAGGALGALVTVAALISATSLLGSDDPTRVGFRSDSPAALAGVGTTLSTTASGDPADPDPGVEAFPGDGDGRDDDHRPADGAAVPAVSGIQTDRWSRLDAPLDGVFAVHQLDGQTLLASATLVDGVLVTSASALGDAERVIVRNAHLVEEAVVRGSDEFADLAVLVPIAEVDLGVGFTTGEGNAEDGTTVRLVSNDGQPLPIIVQGHLLAFDQRAQTRVGRTILGTLHTSARVPEAAAGAPMLDDDGHLVGMVIDCQNYLAFALPADRISGLSTQILETGWADPAWIGLEGTASEDGVIVTKLDADGPATRSGLTSGDLITGVRLDDVELPVADIADLVAAVRRAGPGAAVDVRVETGDRSWVTRLVVAERPIRPNPLDRLSADD